MSDIIDHTEHLGILNVGIGASLIIEKDSGSPVHENHVRVAASGISLGLGSSVLVQNDGVLALSGLADVNLLGTIDIGDGGRLVLNGALNVGLLSNIDFVGHTERSVLSINATHLTAAGNLNGFGVDDVIRLNHLTATSADFAQGLLGSGVLSLYSGNTLVGQIGLEGTYQSDNFAVTDRTAPNGTNFTSVQFVPNGSAAFVSGASIHANYDIAGHAESGAFGFH